jgi:prophage endopeptidase
MSARYLIAIFLIALAGGLIYSANHYHTKYQEEQQRANQAVKLADSRLVTINEMEGRQRDVATLDAKYTGELADAKATIDQLRLDVAAGARGLRVSASCKPVSGPTGTASLDDAASPRLSDSAQRDYFTLRERIETARKQIAGLQDYIRQQCLTPRAPQ